VFFLHHGADGPASIPFTDIVGIARPKWFTPITLYFNKECEQRHVQNGVLDVKPEDVIQHGRLEPGKMFLVDMNEGVIEDIRNQKAS
jgi:glutamate synthase (ferredoxin)